MGLADKDIQAFNFKGGPWTRYTMLPSTKTYALTRHTRTTLHRVCQEVLEGNTLKSPEELGRVPTFNDWQAVMRDVELGRPQSKKGIKGVGQRKKVRFMQWCLAEAKRELVRRDLLKATTISLSCDKRGTRFLLRFRCVDDELRLRAGILDISQCMSSTATDYKKATVKGIQQAMRAGTPPNYLGKIAGAATATAQLNDKEQDELRKVGNKVEHFAADGASDVQLAGRALASNLMLTGPTVEEIQGLILQDLPSIKAVSRDRSHACQRTVGYAATGKVTRLVQISRICFGDS